MSHSKTSTGHDAWLHALRCDPSPAFAERLRMRLRAQEQEPASVAPRHTWSRRPLIAAAAIVVAAIVISVPSVRASVAQFVSLFRVVHVVGIPVDPGRLARLKAEHLEIGTLIGEHVDVVRDPGPPVHVATLADAASSAGMPLALPQWLPDNSRVIETAVVGERLVRVTADSLRLQQVMDALGINDLTVPSGLDGHIVDVRVPPVVMIRYEHGAKGRSRLYQARSPHLTLPEGIDLPALGEIGLRILGLAPSEAHQFAQAIDWNSTLIVPVPPNATSLRQVNIGGRLGVIVQHQPRDQSPTTTILWSTSDRVFALVSIEGVDAALGMATSVR